MLDAALILSLFDPGVPDAGRRLRTGLSRFRRWGL